MVMWRVLSCISILFRFFSTRNYEGDGASYLWAVAFDKEGTVADVTLSPDAAVVPPAFSVLRSSRGRSYPSLWCRAARADEQWDACCDKTSCLDTSAAMWTTSSWLGLSRKPVLQCSPMDMLKGWTTPGMSSFCPMISDPAWQPAQMYWACIYRLVPVVRGGGTRWFWSSLLSISPIVALFI